MEQLQDDRDGKIQWIKKLEKWLDKITDTNTREQCSVRLERLIEVWREILDIEHDLLGYEDAILRSDEFENEYLDIKAKLLKEINDRNKSTTVNTDNLAPLLGQMFEQQRSFLDGVHNSTLNRSSSNEYENLKFPKITFQQFDGVYRNWPAFQDAYCSSIHNNESISKVIKFKLLKRLLGEGPLSLIKNMLETDSNYTEAWEKLVLRYDKKKHILNSYITSFMDLPPAFSGKASDIRSLSDKMDEIIIGIKTMGPNAEHRDAWLIQIILRKLDNETRQEWVKQTIDKDFPTITEFLRFLNIRCDSIDDNLGYSDPKLNRLSSQRTYTTNRKPFVKSMSLNVSDSCLFCNREGHSMSSCYKFRYLSGTARRSTAKNMDVCERCLDKGHTTSSCGNRNNCRHCDQPHHTLLHVFDSNSKQSTIPHINTNSQQQTHIQPSTFPRQSTTSLPSSSAHQSTSSPQSTDNHPSTSSHLSTVKSLPIQSEFSKPNYSDLNSSIEAQCAASSMSNPEQLNPNYKPVYPCISLLPTALINVSDCNGVQHLVYALLDSGSQCSFVAERLIQRLRLPRFHSSLAVSGLSNDKKIRTKGFSSINLSSRFANDPQYNVNAFILSTIIRVNPENLNIPNKDHFQSLNLADPDFNKMKDIEILLGSDIFFDLLNQDKIIADGRTQAQSTVFGWILLSPPIEDFHNVKSLSTISDSSDINQTLQRFWELEEPPTFKSLTPDEERCESYFNSTVKRDPSGRCVVKLPFKEPNPKLGFSKSSAVRRLLSMERRFDRDPSLKTEYSKFMAEYLSMGHMELVPEEESMDVSNAFTYYLPHHAVFKLDSSTTKLRVVFDGSSKASSGLSLNDSLLVGPTVQDDLITIISRFRYFPVVFSADVEKMYRQVLVGKPDDDYQRIVWRFSSEEKIQTYRLCTVTYGTSSAPFLAVRVLHKIADDCQVKFPKVSEMIKKNFYIDDLLAGAEDAISATALIVGLNQVLKEYGFPLRKWKSNSAAVLSSIPDEIKDPSMLEFDDETAGIKTLGLQWNPVKDVFSFTISLEPTTSIFTKRQLLSEVSRIFDPLGWASPVTITFKIMMQRLWALNLSWDDTLPSGVTDQWLAIKSSLHHLARIEIPRHLKLTASSSVQVHGFSDASESAYSAVVYLRVVNPGGVNISLVVGKSKVSPIKQISLPRLELCGAVLVTKLLNFTVGLVSSFKPQIYAWTDSQIVLSWLSDHPRRWKTFVANRTSEILSHTSRQNWNYVKSKDNPADSASRGVTPQSFSDLQLWWSGPDWLSKPSKFWPSESFPPLSNLPEIRKSDVLVNVQVAENEMITSLLERYSCLHKIQRILAFVLQFLTRPRMSHFVDYYSLAEKLIVKNVQASSFPDEIKTLREKKSLNSKSILLSLTPFLDSDGILRVGGRLENFLGPIDVKHPIILPKSHRYTYLVIYQSHLQHLHPGPSLQCSLLKQKFWIVNCRSVVRSFINRCIMCFRLKKKASLQLMGNLPCFRVTECRVFQNVGVDYAGPIILKTREGSGNIPKTKGYICLFICLATKAVHIELVGDMSGKKFTAALRRFVSRRGVPNTIVSDNGTNFKSSRKELMELHQLFNDSYCQALISSFCSQRHIKFSFIPARAPHFGGLWESNIKSMKHHLRRVTVNAPMTYEEMSTLLCQIEAVLNSRPLCPMTSDVDDLRVLTPGHFILGEAPTAIPEPSLEAVPLSHQSRWQNVQNKLQSFWVQFRLEYVHTLQKKYKWKEIQPNLKINDMVLILEDDLPPCQWSLGRVTELHPGKDNLVRVVSVRTKTGIYKRPVVKLCKLPIDESPREDQLEDDISKTENPDGGE